MSIILGIDPWTTNTWFAVIKKDISLDLIDYGILSTTPKIDLAIKLLEIWNDMKNLINKYKPALVVVEKIFFTKNLKTWIDVSHARGVILYEIIKNDLVLLEYTPLQVKKAIAWNWKANKVQLQNAIKILFKMNSIPKPDDSADAIWLAYMGALHKEA